MARIPWLPVRRRCDGARSLLAGVVLLGAVGSCELPNPNLPSIGSAPGAGLAAVIVPARGGGTS